MKVTGYVEWGTVNGSDLLTAKQLHRLQLQNTEHEKRDTQRVFHSEN